jgi:hypothetical protein
VRNDLYTIGRGGPRWLRKLVGDVNDYSLKVDKEMERVLRAWKGAARRAE